MRFSAEGTAVIVHDETLDRLFGLPRRVRELSVTELAGIGVPTLTEVLAAMPAATLIDLELKERPTDALFTTKPGGLGLGLEIATRIVRQHHGTLILANAPGGGAVVVVDLPHTLPANAGA